MPDKCIVDPERDCLGRQRADEVAGEAKAKTRALEERLEDLRRSTASTSQRFGERIGELEAANKVRGVEIDHLNRRLDEIDKDMTDHHREQKEAIKELREETKESMQQLKEGNQQILDLVRPLEGKIQTVDGLSKDVRELKEKPAKKWENATWEVLKWLLLLVCAIAAAKIGLKV